MNIKEAKEQIMNAMTAYFTKNEFGEYEIPIEKQRPVFLMGPPGIGKTAIMEQIASELDVGLVSYSMTHHTRQSALGLPFIEKKTYGGHEYSVSEYTMSEIIASVYDMIEETGHKEGILFLDEINCVSETLAPSMLQFLQYKVFGGHRVPDGWIVVTAGNPPEYNNSVREFDIVTWDRLKRIDIEPDYDVWKQYALESGTHPAVTTYLDIKKSDFYKIESSVDGKTFVTARGWSDLADMIKLYEAHELPIDEKLIAQYIQNPKIAKSFAVYYDLFNKYRADYQVDLILAGKADESVKSRARAAKFDERLSLIGLILDSVVSKTRNIYRAEKALREYASNIKIIKPALNTIPAHKAMETAVSVAEKKIADGKRSSSLDSDDIHAIHSTSSYLEKMQKEFLLNPPASAAKAFEILREDFTKRTDEVKKNAEKVGAMLENVFNFCESVFGDGQEVLILVTELTVSYYTTRFISHYGCNKYFQHNKELLFYERQKEIIADIDGLSLE